jgi:hypothetical protein
MNLIIYVPILLKISDHLKSVTFLFANFICKYSDLFRYAGTSLFYIGVDIDPRDNNNLLGVVRLLGTSLFQPRLRQQSQVCEKYKKERPVQIYLFKISQIHKN